MFSIDGYLWALSIIRRSIYQSIQLYSLSMSELTLFQQLQQVQIHQLRMAKYHHIYTKSLNDQYESNEFLSVPQPQPHQSFYDQPEEMPLFESKRQVVNCEQPQIFQSHVVNIKEEIRLSRIFEDIVISSQNNSTVNDLFDVEIQIEGMTIPISAFRNTKQHYSLSNFSSFNNCMSKPQPQLDFRQLLENIQQTTGKTLTKASIDSIIAQIHQYTQEIMADLECQQNKQTTKKQQYSLLSESCFDIRDQTRHKFDTTLNNCPFNRQKNKAPAFQNTKNQNRALINKSLFQIGRNHKESQNEQKKKNVNSRGFVKDSNRQEKENRREKTQNKEGEIKSIRIFCKGARQMVMSFSESKQIEHFCIVNKIFGKEKDKLLRAVQANKSIIHLQ